MVFIFNDHALKIYAHHSSIHNGYLVGIRFLYSIHWWWWYSNSIEERKCLSILFLKNLIFFSGEFCFTFCFGIDIRIMIMMMMVLMIWYNDEMIIDQSINSCLKWIKRNVLMMMMVRVIIVVMTFCDYISVKRFPV